jgi:hypothetical protein
MIRVTYEYGGILMAFDDFKKKLTAAADLAVDKAKD